MNTITAKQMTLRNFKGEAHRVIEFGKRTQIYGDNETGKTTIADAYSWVLFGKDSKGDTDFDIKTLDGNNEPIHKLEHEVEFILSNDTKLRKVYRETWRKKRGEYEERLTGHTTSYFVNDVPKSKTEYEIKVSSIINSDIARLISDTKYFNEILDWKQRRQIISSLTDIPTLKEITDNSVEALQDVVTIINQGKTLEEERKRVKSQVKIQKDELKTIDPKIEENNRMKPEALEWDLLDVKLIKSEGRLQDINETLSDLSKAYQSQAADNAKLIKSKANKQTEYSRLDTENRNTPNAELDAYYTKLNTLKDDRQELSNKHTEEVRNRNGASSRIAMCETDLNNLRNDYKILVAQTFLPDSTECPTCKREYDNAQEQAEQARANFNTNKAEEIRVNNERGRAKAAEKMNLESELKAIEERIENLTTKVNENKSEIDALVKPSIEHKPTPEMITLKDEIDAIVIPDIVKTDVSELEASKKSIQEEIDELKKQLAIKERIVKYDTRIKDLTEQKRTISQEIANLERLEFQIEAYQNSEMDLIEKRVNDKFALVKFKMFEKQMNEGIKQTCVAMVNGVPYKSVNTAGQIQASLDIINTIQHHYAVFTPVFIDNAESITSIPEMQCQTVELIVKKGQKEIKVLTLD